MTNPASSNSRPIRFRYCALAEGRLPEGIPRVGDYEIELKPEGPVTVTGLDLEQVRGAFPFH